MAIEFGVPMEAMGYLSEQTADLLYAAYNAGGLDALSGALDERVLEGTVPRVVAAHIMGWMVAKTSSPMYVIEYAKFCREMLLEWEQEGLDPPELDDGFDDFALEPGRTPYRAPTLPGRNEPCHCGSGRKYKRCHGNT
jgi:hypothetical protein